VLPFTTWRMTAAATSATATRCRFDAPATPRERPVGTAPDVRVHPPAVRQAGMASRQARRELGWSSHCGRPSACSTAWTRAEGVAQPGKTGYPDPAVFWPRWWRRGCRSPASPCTVRACCPAVAEHRATQADVDRLLTGTEQSSSAATAAAGWRPTTMRQAVTELEAESAERGASAP
jgi:hypothetical protein